MIPRIDRVVVMAHDEERAATWKGVEQLANPLRFHDGLEERDVRTGACDLVPYRSQLAQPPVDEDGRIVLVEHRNVERLSQAMHH